MNRLLQTLLTITAALLLAACSASPASEANTPYDEEEGPAFGPDDLELLEFDVVMEGDRGLKAVQMRVVDGKNGMPEVQVTSGPTDCAGKFGCIKTPYNKTARVKFRLNSEGWYFNRFRICTGANATPVDTKCALKPLLRMEFAATELDYEDREDPDLVLPNRRGIIRLERLGEGESLHAFRVFNQNSVRQDYFYQIEICRDGTSGGSKFGFGQDPANCPVLDPPWPNRGRGRL